MKYRAGNSIASPIRERNVSLDVLRCLLMFGVVFQHSFALCKINGCIPYCMYPIAFALTRPSVDGFTSISGWYGVRCSVWKLIKLICLIFFIGTVHHLIGECGRFVCGDFYRAKYGIDLVREHWAGLSFECYRYWYLGAYIKLLILSLALNPFMDWILKRCGKVGLIILCSGVVLISYVSLFWCDWASHSSRTVIFIYIITRGLVLLGFPQFLQGCRVKKLVLAAVVLLLFVEIVINAHYKLGWNVGDYRSPFTILTGIALVSFFSLLEFNREGALGKMCSLIAPSMVVVYMLHWNFLKTWLSPLPHIIVNEFNFIHPVAALLMSSGVVFLICCALDLLRREVIKFVQANLDWFATSNASQLP